MKDVIAWIIIVILCGLPFILLIRGHIMNEKALHRLQAEGVRRRESIRKAMQKAVRQ